MDRPGGGRPTRRLVWVVGGALLIAGYWGVPLAYRAVMAPWSIGRDTLLGTWSGSLRAKQGAQYGLYLDLAYQERRVSYRKSVGGKRPNLIGRAVLCTPLGERFEYAVNGSVSRAGEIEHLWLEHGDPRRSALNIRMSGAWRSDALTLTPSPRRNPFLPDGRFVTPRAVSRADPDDSFASTTLTARDPEAFEAICERVRG